MDYYNFYKSVYDRELARKVSLDTAVSLPLTILTGVFAINSYFLKDEAAYYKNIDYSLMQILIYIFTFLLFSTLLYLVKFGFRLLDVKVWN